MKTEVYEEVSLTAQVDRSLIPANESCERYALLTLKAPQIIKSSERLPLNLSLIIDRSGSMSGKKLEYVKEAAVHALRLLSDEDRVSIITYDDEVKVVNASKNVTNKAKQDMISHIRAIKPGGMTNLSGGWFSGCDQIADFMTDKYLNRALLLTDGLANEGITDQEELVSHAKQLRRRSISTTTFGVGQDFNQFLLQGIADNGGGHFYFIDHPNQIPNYFEGELGEMLTTVAREMTLEIDTSGGINVDLLNATPTEKLHNRVRIFLGDAYGGEERGLVLKFELAAQPIARNMTISLTLKYESVQQQKTVTIQADPIHFTVSNTQACKTQSVNEVVLKEAGKLEVERAKQKARASEYESDFATAQQILNNAKKAAIFKIIDADEFEEELDAEAAEIAAMRSGDLSKARYYASYLKQRTRRDYKK